MGTEALVGVTEIETSVGGGVTVKAAVLLVMPSLVAEIFAVPSLCPVARPFESIVALEFELDQVTKLVRSAVLPSE